MLIIMYFIDHKSIYSASWLIAVLHIQNSKLSIVSSLLRSKQLISIIIRENLELSHNVTREDNDLNWFCTKLRQGYIVNLIVMTNITTYFIVLGRSIQKWLLPDSFSILTTFSWPLPLLNDHFPRIQLLFYSIKKGEARVWIWRATVLR